MREGESVAWSALILSHRFRARAGKRHEGGSLEHLGRVLTTQGHPFGGVTLHRTRRIFGEQGYRQAVGVAAAFLAERSIFLGDFMGLSFGKQSLGIGVIPKGRTGFNPRSNATGPSCSRS